MSKYKILRKVSQLISVTNFRKILDFLSHYIGGVWKRMDENHMFLAGAGIAYTLVISMIPFVMIIFAVVGNFVSIGELESSLIKLIDTVIPYPEYADYTKRVILSRIPSVIEYKTFAGYVGTLGLLFTSTWLFSSMRTVLNGIFGVSKDKGAFIGILRDFGMVILLIVFLLLSNVILPGLNILFDFADNIDFLKSFQISEFLNFVFSFFSFVIIFVLFYVFYTLIPYEKLGRKVPAVAALWATILWEGMRSIFGYYVTNFLSTNKLYGAFLLIAVVAFWIFYSSVLFVLGAEIGQLYRERCEARSKKKGDNVSAK